MSLTDVDWSEIPAPINDGAAAHLVGLRMPDIALPSTDGGTVDLSTLSGRCVLYVYPMTGRPDRSLPDGWDQIPGARGCTLQSCSFRDHAAELAALGVTAIYGISTQSNAYQAEAAERLHLPFALLSDAGLELGRALNLPGMIVEGDHLHKRMSMIVDGGEITKVFYPIFPPDKDAENVIAWLQEQD